MVETTTHSCKPACPLPWPFSPPLARYEDHTCSPPHPQGRASISLPASFWLSTLSLKHLLSLILTQLNLSSTVVERQPPKSPPSNPACILAETQSLQMKLRCHSRLQWALHSKPPESKEEEGMKMKMDMIKKVSVVAQDLGRSEGTS